MAQSVLDPVVLEPLTQHELARKNLDFGKKLLASGDSRKALKFLELSAEQEPSAEAFILLARIELEFPGLRPKALEHLKQAVAVSPRCTEAWLMLAEFWAAKHDQEKQRRCLEKVLAYDPENADARRALNDINLWE